MQIPHIQQGPTSEIDSEEENLIATIIADENLIHLEEIKSKLIEDLLKLFKKVPEETLETFESDITNLFGYLYPPRKNSHVPFSVKCLDAFPCEEYFKCKPKDNTKDNSKINILTGSRGCGKTRFIFEKILQCPGVYFSFSNSMDLLECKKLCEDNVLRAREYIDLLHFSRNFLLKFLGENPTTANNLNLIQIEPLRFYNTDIFKWLYSIMIKNFESWSKIPKDYSNYVFFDDVEKILICKTSDEFRSNCNFSEIFSHTEKQNEVQCIYLALTGLFYKRLSDTFKNINIEVNEFNEVFKPLERLEIESFVKRNLKSKNFNTEEIDNVLNDIEEICNIYKRPKFFALILDEISSVNRPKVADLVTKAKELMSNVEEFKKIHIIPHHSFDDLTPIDTIFRAIIKKNYFNQAPQLLFNKHTSVQKFHAGVGYLTKNPDVDTYNVDEEAVQSEILGIYTFFHQVQQAKEIIISSIDKPAMGKAFEFFVALKIWSQNSGGSQECLKGFRGNIFSYLAFGEKNEVFFPENSCGPDIIFKFDKTLWLVQVKFVNDFSPANAASAYETTDPKTLYKHLTKKNAEEFQTTLQKAIKDFTFKRYLVICHENEMRRSKCPKIEDVSDELNLPNGITQKNEESKVGCLPEKEWLICNHKSPDYWNSLSVKWGMFVSCSDALSKHRENNNKN